MHHSICVHIGNKLFIVHMALPFFVSFIPWAPALLRHLGRWREERDRDSPWGASSAWPAPQSTGGEPERVPAGAAATALPSLTGRRGSPLPGPPRIAGWAPAPAVRLRRPQQLFAKVSEGQWIMALLRLPRTVPLHLLPSLKKTQVPSPALVRASCK